MIQLIKQFPAPLNQLHNWQPGDMLTHLDGQPLNDILDLYYYTPETQNTELRLQRQNGEVVAIQVDPADIGAVTQCFAPMEFKICACDCVFCFVDQNPQGMRAPIYVKDEDYRFSFLYGNYITLTSLGKKGIKRIIDQGMSPLYVSVHATDVDVRTRMLGIKRKIDVLAILDQFKTADIEIHAQIVLCPGWNDGAILEQTFRDLLALAAPSEDGGPFQPVTDRGYGYRDSETSEESATSVKGGVRSLAVVPVGLSKHRSELTSLDPVSQADAQNAIKQVQQWQQEAFQKIGYHFIYLSDEFYLLTGAPFPAAAQYDGFWQVDSAIGMTPRLRDLWDEELGCAKDENTLPTLPLTIITGLLAAKAWEREFQPVLEKWSCPPVEVRGVPNNFYGHNVTVAGLLSGEDVRQALLGLPSEPLRTVILSPRIFNSDGFTLDDLTLADIAKGQPHRVLVGEEDEFIAFWSGLD